MNTPLITVASLQAEIGKGVVVIDCRFNLMDKTAGYQQYRQGHIPGAYYFDLEQDLSGPRQTHGGRHPLPELNVMAQKLRDIGVNPSTLIVAYDDSRMAYAARCWWLLRYLGHQNLAILDGGYQAWCAAGGAIDRREPSAKAGTFKPQRALVRDISYNQLFSNGDSPLLIDSREAERYAGLAEPIDPVAGHIPGAVNYFWQDVTDEQGFMKPAAWQQQHWQAVAGEKNLVVYCGSGVTACVNLFSLYISGIDAALYSGSWSDWCSYLDQDKST